MGQLPRVSQGTHEFTESLDFSPHSEVSFVVLLNPGIEP